MNKTILNSWQENGTMSMIIHMQIIILEIKLSIITEVLKSNLCDYNVAYILVKDDITVTAAPATQVSFKHCAIFARCIKKLDWTTTDDAEYLDLVMTKYNLKEYSSKYSETTKKDKASNFNNNIEKTDNFKSLKYEAKLLENTVA